ncbi:MAG: sodium/solute symporter [Acidimicrobiia bacterium]|nr:sodium/solute symporter [Acidimicrobiia bacterium]
MHQQLWGWLDWVVVALNLAVSAVVGAYFTRRNKSTDAYFLAGRKMSGAVVGLSLMATIISSMTFLAMPGFTFKQDWRYVYAHLPYLLVTVVALYLFMPFFRRTRIQSAYEYLERRFGVWARLYAATGFVLFHAFKMGAVLYAVSLPLASLCGVSIAWIILVLGILVTAYTVAGGLEAVIWTDVIQGVALVLGAVICLPLMVHLIPGGFSQIVEEAYRDAKFAPGSTAFNLSEKTLWVISLVYLFQFLQMMATDQMIVQRYCAMKSDEEAKKGLVMGSVLSVVTWVYFSFLGTTLYVFYKYNAAPELSRLLPEEVFPFFISTRVPTGLAGFVISGLIAAALSTLSAEISALATTASTDFYRRLIRRHETERHYVLVGRWCSTAFGVVMLSVALIIYYSSSSTLMDLQTLFFSILGGGLLGLFLLGFVTERVDNRSALIATICTFTAICVWLALDSPLGRSSLPGASRWLPDKFWLGVLANCFLFTVGYLLSLLKATRQKDLAGLTIWSKTPYADRETAGAR